MRKEGAMLLVLIRSTNGMQTHCQEYISQEGTAKYAVFSCDIGNESKMTSAGY